jgi:hypothetical protein
MCDQETGRRKVLNRFIPVDGGGAERSISRYTSRVDSAPAGTPDSAGRVHCSASQEK